MVQALALPAAARLWQPMEGGTVRNAWTGLGAYYGVRAAAEASLRRPLPYAAAEAALGAVATAEVASLSEDLGSRWVIGDSYLKPYACARWIHPALDAMSSAVVRRDGPPGTESRVCDIERIEVDTFAYAASLRALQLRSDLHARFSLPTCLATLALDGELHAAGFLPERLSRPEVHALAARVIVRERADFTGALPNERPTTVTIAWRDGGQTSRHVRNARGNPDDPLSRAEVEAKFRANVDTVLSPDLSDLCLEGVLTVGHTTSLGSVAQAIS
jgi:2-methylcitrate dehydratase PrpD